MDNLFEKLGEILKPQTDANKPCVSGALPLLDKILEEEMSAEMRTWLMELRLLIGNDR